MKDLFERSATSVVTPPKETPIKPNQGGGIEPPKYRPTASNGQPEDSLLWQQISAILKDKRF